MFSVQERLAQAVELAETELDPEAGTGEALSEALAWEQEVYEADPLGGQPHRY